MPRNPDNPPYKSKMNERSGGYGNYRFDTSIPKPVGDAKGIWIVKISKDNKITWLTHDQYQELLETIKSKKAN